MTARLLATTQFAVGVALLSRPRRVLALTGEAPTSLVRLLGLRLTAQGAYAVAAPTAGTMLAGGVVDALHGASMAAVAVAGRRYRRPALASSAFALASAAASVGIARSRHHAEGS